MPDRESNVLPHDHAVMFYDDDGDLADRVADLVMAGLARHEPCITVTTGDHRASIERSLRRRGVDVPHAQSTGQWQPIDAEETLAGLVRHGRLDVPTMRVTIGNLLDSASAAGQQVHVFGEMVAILWGQGDAAAALELEGLWNELASDRDFALLCGYPGTMLDAALLEDLDRVCGLHTSVAPPPSYLSGHGSTLDTAVATDQASQVFVCVPAAVPAVRRFVMHALHAWDLAEAIPDAVLVASELATNALRHTRSPFRVALVRSGSSVRILVEDLGGGYPSLCLLTDDMTWGRGVFIVDEVCTDWGADQLPLGKVVWADLGLPG
jgi:anti-sigma regulatory factor (Ser/Thr protein kinase)